MAYMLRHAVSSLANYRAMH